MTKLFYAINGTKDGQRLREYHKSSGSIDKVIEQDKTEIKKLQELVGWTEVAVNYRGQFGD